MKTKFVLISILFFLSVHFSSAQTITEYTDISIITCAPGNELYSTFGHTAIRVKDPLNRIDKVYNYGTFDFESPNFYLKFTRGQLDYMLSVSPYKYFIISYMNEDRWIKEQVLNLSYEHKKEIYAFLENNALPENKFYRYDFFYDNCATRVKDVIKNVVSDDLIYAKSVTKNGETFKDLMMPYLKGKAWERFGINLVLGNPANKVVSVDEASYLPDYTEMIFDSCSIIIDGQQLPLVRDKRMLFDTDTDFTDQKTFLTPALLFWCIFILYFLISLLEFRKKTYFILADKLLFFITGFIGIIVLLVWFATDHSAVVNNWDILWTIPVFFVIAFFIRSKANLTWVKSFLFIWSLFLLFSVPVDLFIYDLYDVAVIPIILLLIFRSGLIVKLRK